MTQMLVLRPEPGAEATAIRAAALGFSLVVAPILTVTGQEWTPPAEPPDALMLTSANAVRYAGPELARYRTLPVYAVGQATADIARAAGFIDIRIGPSDAAGYRRVIKFCALQRVAAMNKRKLKEKALRSGGVMGVPQGFRNEPYE